MSRCVDTSNSCGRKYKVNHPCVYNVYIAGPSKLPELGKGLGKTAKSFQSAAKEFEKELKEEMKDDDDETAQQVKEEPKKPAE